ncbi:MAG: outer membrane lipoprotein chaperone LolA [Gammaproteobacteria bacterium]|jgi:outer membrane lipoprotein carrier protein
MRCFLLNAMLAVLWVSAPAAAADDSIPAELREFFAGIESIRGEFRQLVFDPRGGEVESAEGELAIARPGRFRWHYTAPYEQLIVADGERLWLYDVDLEQVTVREQTGSLSQSPAMLLGGDTTALDAFRYLGSYSADGYDWMRLEPVAPESDFRYVSLAFSGGDLESMELADALGQVTRIEFSDLVLNAAPDESLFRFEPPAGVDVIGATEVPGEPPPAASE